jgi:putative oxidoreductase
MASLKENIIHWAAPISLVILRAYTGLALAFNHGLHKLPPSDRFIQRVGEMGFPQPEFFAYAAGISEFAGGIFLALGFLTRPSCFFIIITMMVAVFVRHAADPFGGGKELAATYAVIALFFLVSGSGKIGVDAVLWKKK